MGKQEYGHLEPRRCCALCGAHVYLVPADVRRSLRARWFCEVCGEYRGPHTTYVVPVAKGSVNDPDSSGGSED